jgi:hypothetical protein
MDYQSGTKLPHSKGAAVHGPFYSRDICTKLFPILQRGCYRMNRREFTVEVIYEVTEHGGEAVGHVINSTS